jgi:hypothetical protein
MNPTEKSLYEMIGRLTVQLRQVEEELQSEKEKNRELRVQISIDQLNYKAAVDPIWEKNFPSATTSQTAVEHSWDNDMSESPFQKSKRPTRDTANWTKSLFDNTKEYSFNALPPSLEKTPKIYPMNGLTLEDLS